MWMKMKENAFATHKTEGLEKSRIVIVALVHAILISPLYTNISFYTNYRRDEEKTRKEKKFVT